jgi:two-component system, OmpR family, KDP operon response regulator KdpE
VTAGPLRVLLVEDEALNRALVRAVLDRRAAELPPLELIEAGTLDRARALLEEAPADIILLDVRLPDGSGLDLARELRDAQAGAPSPVVAILSASVLALERVAADAAGADAFLAKPFVPAELTALIQRMATMVEERRGAV